MRIPKHDRPLAPRGRDLIYGRQPVREVLRAGRRTVFRLLLAENARPDADIEELSRLAAKHSVQIARVHPQNLNNLAGSVHHQGVVAETANYPYGNLDEVLKSAAARESRALVLLLDHIQDPQNLGSILRSAEVAGADAVVIPADRAVGVTPAVVRASAGASEHVRVGRVTNLARAMRELREAGFFLAGLDAAPSARLYTEPDWHQPVGLVVGGEGEGLHRLVRETCDVLIRIPLRGRVDSLNAGVAAAVALFEIRRQQSAVPPPDRLPAGT